jgi:hypothetical protein
VQRNQALDDPVVPDINAWLALLEQAILNLRMRIRYGENVSLREVHDILDALHNVPIMFRKYGGWHVEGNIEVDLASYDNRWLSVPGSDMRKSLVETLNAARRGEYDR